MFYSSGKMLPALLTLCATCLASCQNEPPERTDECSSPEQAARSIYALVSPAAHEGLTFQPDRFGEGMSGFIISKGEQELARIVIDDETCRLRYYSNIYIK